MWMQFKLDWHRNLSQQNYKQSMFIKKTMIIYGEKGLFTSQKQIKHKHMKHELNHVINFKKGVNFFSTNQFVYLLIFNY